MEKKNPYKFTLGFDKTKPSHVRATEILNSVKDKADLIASALVSYIDDVRQEEGAVLSNEALQVLMQEMVKQEVAKAMHLHSIKPEEPNHNSNSVMAVQQESLETIAMKFGIWENHKKVKNYSLGMKQKLGIILALIGKPQLLVLDEPLNGLDPKSTIQIRKLLSDLREKGITILISSHILDELFRVATDYIFISQGTIKKNFTYEEIVHKYPDKMPEEIYLDILEE